MENRYIDVQFVHFTVPLTTIQTGFKAWLKKLIGKQIGSEANIVRNKYNDLIKSTYQDTGLVFDLASIEAEGPNGDISSFGVAGNVYMSMHEAYTDDGGHLNYLGQKNVAEKLLVFLANVQK